MTGRTYLSMGSNLGDREQFLSEAVMSLGPAVRAVSSLWETDPVGGPDQDRFLNIVVELDTGLSPRDLLAVCHRLESGAGRVRHENWGPRTLDVDIVWMDGIEVDEEDLQIPHPRMNERRFVLQPLAELAPDLVDPAVLEQAQGQVERIGSIEGWPRPHDRAEQD